MRTNVRTNLTPNHFYPLSIKQYRKDTNDCCIVTFDIPHHLQDLFVFQAGQYVTLHANIEGESVRRSYSICSSPSSGELSVGIKRVEGGKFSTFANTALHVGDTIDVMHPIGHFTIKDYTPINRILLVAAGSGITPMMSHIHEVLSCHPHISIDLLYANRVSDSIIFKEELINLKDKYLSRLGIHYIFSREKIGIPLMHGRLDTDKCTKIFKSLIFPSLYDEALICGPNEMIFAVKDSLIAAGMDKSKVHFELFNTTGLTNAQAVNIIPSIDFDPSTSCHVTVKLDGEIFELVLDYGGKNILDAALDAGADLPFACKGGVCSTCKARITEGKTEMTVNYALEPEEIGAGFVLTCQAHPRSETLFVDFDEK